MIIRVGLGARWITDLPISLFNSLMETRLEEHDVDSAILAVKEDATRRNVPLLWWIGPSTRPVDLGHPPGTAWFSLGG